MSALQSRHHLREAAGGTGWQGLRTEVARPWELAYQAVKRYCQSTVTARGADRFQGVTMEHVVFTGCKLDYAVLDQIRADGPVLFAGCSLREAELTGCSLPGAAFDGCDLRLTAFGPGNYRRCDLRGNDLPALIGAAHLKRVILDPAQTAQLGEALAAELKMTFGDEAAGHP